MDLDLIRDRLDEHKPPELSKEGMRRAAVALVLSERAGHPEILFIERARREGDPWSGHMAFPGGRLEPRDPTSRAAAERETFEEVGVCLGAASYLGPLADLQGNPRSRPSNLVVSAHVFHLPEKSDFELEESEVAHALWFPVPELLAPDRHVEWRAARVPQHSFPGILVGEPERHVVWGLTYRFLDIFLEVIGHPLLHRSEGAEFLREGARAREDAD